MRFVIQSSLLIAALFAAGCSLIYTEPGDPLSRAAFAGDLAQVRQLIAAGAPPNQALQWAARGGHPAGPHRCRYELPERDAIVRALLDAGANVDVRDGRRPTPGGSSGWTPLHQALHHGQYRIALALLERGANPDAKSDQGMTPTDMARIGHAPEAVMQQLLSHRVVAGLYQGGRE
jgi:ankyrin repeat protein